MKIFSLMALAAILTMQGCETKSSKDSEAQNQQSTHMLLSTAWYQKAAERKALYYQAFNIAKLRVDEILKNKGEKNSAVVLDIDETVLDNSPYQGWCIENDSTFSSISWDRWVQQGSAAALNGALDFTTYAKQNGMEVIYISNRHVSQMDATLKNLKEEGFPNASREFVFLKDTTSDKQYRRAKVEEKYSIDLLIGDNLGDFDHLYDKRKNQNAHKVLENQKTLFGNKFIVLPNPMYGKWERPYQKMDGNYVENLIKHLESF
ncbi:Outer membrane protein P4 [Salinivirga cyanobacteriivorans]|uniref:Outer membrane protein P4 n=1 Tax=Salinivirga cyanobacteriivorans TaxID=1307839 RepID=A0A0S2I083_9BACT|nr:5'-nucleotidase, lipoprotein e(P4) family [Salinivirga cyanobacteriivorans]ALO15691.1 Outer membrane protein P4 [Salinivirga cyanobacteriivorans]